MSEELVEAVARQLCKAHLYGTDWRNWADEARAAIALIRPVVLEEAAHPAFLRPLIEEQSAGEWDDKTIDRDVAMFSAAIRALKPAPAEPVDEATAEFNAEYDAAEEGAK